MEPIKVKLTIMSSTMFVEVLFTLKMEMKCSILYRTMSIFVTSLLTTLSFMDALSPVLPTILPIHLIIRLVSFPVRLQMISLEIDQQMVSMGCFYLLMAAVEDQAVVKFARLIVKLAGLKGTRSIRTAVLGE